MPRKLCKHRLVRVLAGGGILIHPQNARTGQQLGQLLLHPLCAEAAVADFAAALGAGLRQRVYRVAAVVAQQCLLRLVIDERHAAIRTFQHMAAGGAHADGAVAAAVEQQNALLAVVEVFLQFPRQPHADLARVACGQFGAHVDEIDAGQGPPAVAVGQLHQLQLAALGGVVGLGQWCGRGKQQQGVFHDRALFGNIVGVKARGGLALVGVLLFLIHDDKAKVLQRCKHCTARTYDNIGVPLLNHPPLQKSLGIVERRMLNGQTAAEGGLEPPYHLRCQADLRHQDQCAAAQLQRALDKPQKHNGLAAAGYAVQQCRVGSGILQIRQQIVKNLLLLRG